jgi:MFS family permease
VLNASGLGRPFWILWCGALVNRLGTMVVPFMTLYLVSSRGFSIVSAGEVVAGFGGGALLAPIVGGSLADQIGRRTTLLAGTAMTACLMVALAYTRATVLIVALVLALGVSIELPRPVLQALVADLIPAHDRARAYSMLFWATNLGFALAMASAGFLAQTDFALLFWIDALTGLAYGLLVWLFVPEVHEPTRRSETESDGYRRALTDRTMMAFTFAVALYYFVYLQSDSTLPLAIHRAGLAPHVFGLCMALNGAVICLAQPLIAPRLLHVNPARIWAIGVAVVGVGFGVTVFATSTGGFLSTVAIWTLGEVLPATVSGAIVARLAPSNLRGRYAGLYGFALSSGWLTSSIGGTRLLALSPALLWGICGASATAAALIVLRLGDRLKEVAISPSTIPVSSEVDAAAG